MLRNQKRCTDLFGHCINCIVNKLDDKVKEQLEQEIEEMRIKR